MDKFFTSIKQNPTKNLGENLTKARKIDFISSKKKRKIDFK